MSCTSSNLLLNSFSRQTSQPVTVTPISSYRAQCSKAASSSIRIDAHNRRQLLFLMTATTAVTAMEMPSFAEDIGLFGLRKKLKKAEEEAEEIVKEGFESAEKGIEAAEKGIVAAERGVVAAERGIENIEKEIETEVSFGFGGGFTQAGVVLGAEVVGVVIASSVVNGILGPET